jgi:hypothetical protein
MNCLLHYCPYLLLYLKTRRNLDHELEPSAIDIRLVALLDESKLSSRMILNTFEVSKFIARAKKTYSCGESSHEWFRLFYFQVQKLDLRLQAWERDAFADLKSYNTSKPNEELSSTSQPTRKYPYPGPWTLSLWNKHRAARILLHQKFLEALEGSASSSNFQDMYKQERRLSQMLICDIAADLLASIPFSLAYKDYICSSAEPKSVGGYFLIWSLQVILRCPYAKDTQRREAREALERVGRECGLKYAAAYAKWFPFDSNQNSTN